MALTHTELFTLREAHRLALRNEGKGPVLTTFVVLFLDAAARIATRHSLWQYTSTPLAGTAYAALANAIVTDATRTARVEFWAKGPGAELVATLDAVVEKLNEVINAPKINPWGWAWWLVAGLGALVAVGIVIVAAVRGASPRAVRGRARPMRLSCPAQVDLPPLVAACAPSICYLRVKTKAGRTGGSAFFATEQLLLTNEHVVFDAVSIEVHLSDGRWVPGRVVKMDAGLDVAVVEVEAKLGMPVCTLGTSKDLRAGQTVFAIGAPLGLELSVTAGVVSHKNRGNLGIDGSTANFIQTDCTIAPGSSGGPLFDTCGAVIGITARGFNGPAVNFAVPIDQARTVLAAAKRRRG